MVTLWWNTYVSNVLHWVSGYEWMHVDVVNLFFQYCGTLVLIAFNWLSSQFIARSDCSWTSLCFLVFLVSVKHHTVLPGLFRCPTNLNLSQDNLHPTTPHAVAAGWQARLPNNSIKQKRVGKRKRRNRGERERERKRKACSLSAARPPLQGKKGRNTSEIKKRREEKREGVKRESSVMC